MNNQTKVRQSEVLDVPLDDLTVALLWTQFAGQVVHPEAGAGQRRDMRASFYAGFMDCLLTLRDIRNSLPGDDKTTLEIISRLYAEAAAHFEALANQQSGEEVGRG